MKRPTQAVILAGGIGERLTPLTLHCPKPLIRINNKPFVKYLVEDLALQGFKKVIFLVGYKAEEFRNYFGTGSEFGIKIDYIETPVEAETGKRIKAAQHVLEDIFFLLYGDNYWPFDFDKLWSNYITCGKSTQLVTYNNEDNYSSSNIKLGPDDNVLKYDKTRKSDDVHAVDLGFIIIKRDLIESFPDEDVSFEKYLYPELVKKNDLHAYRTDHRYYSITNIQRLSITEKFLNGPKYIFLDRDGVINKRPGPAMYVKSWDDWEWEDGAIQSIVTLTKNKYRIIIITNQPGIGREIITQPELEHIHVRMKSVLKEHGGEIEHIYYCPHGWNDNCNCRKPKPGLLLRAHRDYHINLMKTPYIGDSDKDQEAAERVGTPYYMVNSDIKLIDIVNGL